MVDLAMRSAICELMIRNTPRAVSSADSPERCAERGERLDGGVTVQAHPAAKEVVGVQVAEHDVGIGDGGLRPAEAVARRAGRDPALWGPTRRRPPSSSQQMLPPPAPIVATRTLGIRRLYCATTGSWSMRDLPPEDQADIERRAADVGAYDVVLAVELAEVPAARGSRPSVPSQA